MRALAFEHLASDPIGVFGDVLAERGIAIDRVLLYEGEPVPDWRVYDFIVAMGAGASVWQEAEYPWIVAEKRAVREAVLAGVPYFGVCFGVQLLADVFGARSFRGPEPEIGVNQVFLTPAARRDPVFRGFPADLEVCEWHTNHFSLPPGAIRLARSPRYENQAIRYGRVAYGLQSHLEPTVEDIRDWLSDGSDAIFEARHGKGSVDRLLDDYAEFVPFLQETGRQVFGRWLQNALAFGVSGQEASAHERGRAATARRRPPIVGRDPELSRIHAALAAAAHAQSAVLVIRGDAGTGKTALLDEAGERARGIRVVRASGEYDSESGEPFTALASLCAPFAELRSELAPGRAEAASTLLDAAADAPVRDRFAVYAAAFDLVVRASALTPLLLLIDDLHLADEASREGIGFIARRLGAEAIAVVIATEAEDELRFADELRLSGLSAPDARALLAQTHGDDLNAAVADQIATAAAGNPLALLEIAAGLTPEQRAGAADLPEPLPISAEWSYLNRMAAVPESARPALLTLALARTRDPEASAAAWRRLRVSDSTGEAVRCSGLVRGEPGRLAFVHPLARAVVSYSALRADRRAAHQALAEVTEGESRVWHRALAAAAPDETVAGPLEDIARRAGDRTAFAAAANALERAARLSPDPDARARRLTEAARAAHLAGHASGALIHADAAIRYAGSETARLAAERVRGRILARGGSADLARDQLVSLSSRYERSDPAKAGAILADAVFPALRAGGPSEAVRLARRAERLTSGDTDAAGWPVLIAVGTALVFAGDYADGAARLERALASAAVTNDPQQLAYLGAGLELAGRHAQARQVLTQAIDSLRGAGAISILPYALIRLADVHIEIGDWDLAGAALDEAARLADETAQPADQGLALGALAWLEGARGEADACYAHAAEAMRIAERLGRGSRLDRVGTATGLLELSRGNPTEAIPSLEAACELQDEQGWSDAARTPHRRPDLIEAYVLAGRGDQAREGLERFRADAERVGRPSALAALARCQLLLADDAHLDEAFAAARADELVNATSPFERARTQLLCAERLISAGRDRDAVPALHEAVPVFDRLGAQPWSERARAAMVRAGAVVSPPEILPAQRLTAPELEVALATARGGSPEQIGARLFLGPRTVQMYLASATIKLGLDTPARLGEVLDVGPGDPTADRPTSTQVTA